MQVRITAAPGAKCERCWCYDEEIGVDAEHPSICPKCLAAVR
jgi:isoleucyl-tRNA synthetase